MANVVAADRLVFGTYLAGWDQGAMTGLGATAPQYSASARRLLRLDR